MRLIIDSENNVDFEAPVFMTEEYQKKLIAFFTKMFPDSVEVTKVNEVEKEFGEREARKDNHHWTPEDYSLLLSPLDNSEIAQKLKISEMAIIIKRGPFVPDFLTWMKKKGYEKITIKIIEQYFKEQG